MKVISRDDARKSGYKRYYTGAPCKYGHISERLVSNCRCVECVKDAKDKRAAWRERNREKLRAQYRDHYYANRRRILDKRSEKYHSDSAIREDVARRSREYHAKNREEKLKQSAEWRKRNREQSNRYFRERRKSDPEYSAKCTMRAMLKRCLLLTSSTKTRRTEDYLGYSADDLRKHIEKQFLKGMGWHNRSDWHVDHITPIAWFFENGITDPKQINCLTNLQPVWAEDNLAKRAEKTKLL